MPAPTNHLSLVTTLIIVVLITWRLYRRISRLVGRQVFHSRRSWTSVILFPLFAVLLLAGSLAYPLNVEAEFAGIVIGVGLAVYGLRLTRFEHQPDGLYYTPNAHIGIALSLLFAGRIVYRMVQLYESSNGLSAPPATVVSSPVTLLIFGTLVGYYVWYAIGLIRKHRSLISDSQPAA